MGFSFDRLGCRVPGAGCRVPAIAISAWTARGDRARPHAPRLRRRHAPGNAHKDKPLSPPAQGRIGLLLATYGNPEHLDPQTYGDAYEALAKYGTGLFGVEPTPTPTPSPTPTH